MSKQVICFNGWWAEIEYQYNYIPAKIYGEMADCYPEESSFEYQVLSYAIDDQEDHCPEFLVKEFLDDEDFVYDLLDMTLEEYPDD